MEQLTLYQRNLFEELCSIPLLMAAWSQVKENTGAAGIDGVSITDFKKNESKEIESLSKELSSWNYFPQAVVRVEIPKPGSTEKRKLGIPTVKDRVVQQGLKLILEPHFEPHFSNSSYGFRPGRGQREALDESKKQVENGKEWVVDIDLDKFFDRINHDRLIHSVGLRIKDDRILRLIGTTLRSGILNNGKLEPSKEGSPQGSPLSPLLSNIVLDELDKELERRGLSFSRYADDAKIYVGSRKAGERVMRSVSNFIENKLKLLVNQSKSKVARTEEVIYLGFAITKDYITMSQKSFKRAMAKTKELIKRRTHIPLEHQISKVNRWYVGWSNYYKMTDYPSQLQSIEAHIRRRFRSQLVSNQKRERNLVRKLKRRGVRESLAKRTAYNKGCWAKSHTAGVERAWNNAWFESEGLKIVSDNKLAHWEPVGVWLKPL